jgi:hypothetical protein
LNACRYNAARSVRAGGRPAAGLVSATVTVASASARLVTPARPVAGAGVQLLDVQALQGVLHIAGDSRPVGARHGLGGVGFGQLAQVRPGSEQLIQHGGLLGRGQDVQR